MSSNDKKLGWHFSQHFGEKTPISEVMNADILSSLEFNETGKYLAAGDNGGRVVIFQQDAAEETKADGMVIVSETNAKSSEYRFFCEFQSHEPEFDYLNSTEIQERINSIQWIPSNPSSLFLISANDKTIKLWRLCEKHTGPIPCPLLNSLKGNTVAEEHKESTVDVVAQNKIIYGHAHSFNINSISCFSDGETFISCDDLRINLWNLEVGNQSFNILDAKPTNMDNLTEVITCAACHPSQCNLFAYSNSRGITTFSDLRVASKSTPCRIYQDQDTSLDQEVVDLVSSISSIKFTPGGRYFLTRDFLAVKVWDMYMEREPVLIMPVHDCLRKQVGKWNDNEIFFDRFNLGISGDGRSFITGSYQNTFHIMDRITKSDTMLEASRRSRLQGGQARPTGPRLFDIAYDNPEFGRKITQVSWHPQQDLVALSSLNNLYIFSSNV